MELKITSIRIAHAADIRRENPTVPDPLHLTDRRTFVRTVLDDLHNHPTLRAAFDHWNNYFEMHANRPRYGSWESFRVTKHRYHIEQKESRQLSLF